MWACAMSHGRLKEYYSTTTCASADVCDVNSSPVYREVKRYFAIPNGASARFSDLADIRFISNGNTAQI